MTNRTRIRGFSAHTVAGRAYRRPRGFAPPGSPCGRGDGPCTCFGRLRRPRLGRRWCVTLYGGGHFFRRRQHPKRFLFCPMRLPSLDSGRLFSAKIAFRNTPFIQLPAGDFAEPFPPPLRASLWARRSALGRAPQGVAHPLTRGRARPAPARLHLLRRSRA